MWLGIALIAVWYGIAMLIHPDGQMAISPTGAFAYVFYSLFSCFMWITITVLLLSWTRRVFLIAAAAANKHPKLGYTSFVSAFRWHAGSILTISMIAILFSSFSVIVDEPAHAPPPALDMFFRTMIFAIFPALLLIIECAMYWMYLKRPTAALCDHE